MPEIIRCPQCQRQLRVPDDLLGRSVKCPGCGETFTAPASGSPPSAPFEGVPGREPPGPPPAHEPAYPDDYEFSRLRNYAPHRGTTILVLGILSLVLNILVVFGPIAWIMGNNDLAEIRARRMDPEGEGLTQAGRICGIIGTILGALNFLCCCLYLAAIMGTVGAGGAR